ncbi:9934_t:CDS:2, partial [Cetraspora pellucida]
RNDFDQQQWHTAKVYEQYNVKDSYNDKSELTHLTYNAKKNFHTSSEISITITTTHEQQSYIKWKDKKFQMQQKDLDLLKEEITL